MRWQSENYRGGNLKLLLNDCVRIAIFMPVMLIFVVGVVLPLWTIGFAIDWATTPQTY